MDTHIATLPEFIQGYLQNPNNTDPIRALRQAYLYTSLRDYLEATLDAPDNDLVAALNANDREGLAKALVATIEGYKRNLPRIPPEEADPEKTETDIAFETRQLTEAFAKNHAHNEANHALPLSNKEQLVNTWINNLEKKEQKEALARVPNILTRLNETPTSVPAAEQLTIVAAALRAATNDKPKWKEATEKTIQTVQTEDFIAQKKVIAKTTREVMPKMLIKLTIEGADPSLAVDLIAEKGIIEGTKTALAASFFQTPQRTPDKELIVNVFREAAKATQKSTFGSQVLVPFATAIFSRAKPEDQLAIIEHAVGGAWESFVTNPEKMLETIGKRAFADPVVREALESAIKTGNMNRNQGAPASSVLKFGGGLVDELLRPVATAASVRYFQTVRDMAKQKQNFQPLTNTHAPGRSPMSFVLVHAVAYTENPDAFHLDRGSGPDDPSGPGGGIQLFAWGASVLSRFTFDRLMETAIGQSVRSGAQRAAVGLLARAGIKLGAGSVTAALGGAALAGPLGIVLGWLGSEAISRVVGRLKGSIGSIVSFFKNFGDKLDDPKAVNSAITLVFVCALGVPFLATLFRGYDSVTMQASIPAIGTGPVDVESPYDWDVPPPESPEILGCPVNGGVITQRPFPASGSHKNTDSYDFGAPTKAAVFSTHPGYVYAYENQIYPNTFIDNSYGNFVKIVGTDSKGNQFMTVYGHLWDVTPAVVAAKAAGSILPAGTEIGYVDATGYTQRWDSKLGKYVNGGGVHLHYELKIPGEISTAPSKITLPPGCPS